MLGFFKLFLLAEVFKGSALKKQQREYEKAVNEHYKKLDKQVKIFTGVIKEYHDDEQLVVSCIANFLLFNLNDSFSLPDIDHMLVGLYQQGFENEAIKIAELMESNE